MIRRLIVPLTVAVVTLYVGQAYAQGAFPAPLPGRSGAPVNDPAFPPVNRAAPANDPAFPPVNGSAPTPSLGASFPSGGAAPFGGGGQAFAPPSQPGDDACVKGFMQLRAEAEKRGKLIKTASDRHAPPAEACKLIGNFAQVETQMVKYVETHAAKCGIPPQISEQLKTGHKNTELMQQRVCAVAQGGGAQQKPAGPSLSEILGSSTELPVATANKKGSTFDTLSGNVLAR